MRLFRFEIAVLLESRLLDPDEPALTLARGVNNIEMLHLRADCATAAAATLMRSDLTYLEATLLDASVRACSCGTDPWTQYPWASEKPLSILKRIALMRSEFADVLRGIHQRDEPSPAFGCLNAVARLRWVAHAPEEPTATGHTDPEPHTQLIAIRDATIEQCLDTADKLTATPEFAHDMSVWRQCMVRDWASGYLRRHDTRTPEAQTHLFGWAHHDLAHTYGWSPRLPAHDPAWLAPRVWVNLPTSLPRTVSVWAFLTRLDPAQARSNPGHLYAELPLVVALGWDLHPDDILAPALGFTAADLAYAASHAPGDASPLERAQYALAAQASRT